MVSAIVLAALILRLAVPWHAPRGWRDDELSSALVVTGHVLDGDFRVYYPDASGHEGLYEYLQAASLLLFGENAWGIRGPSILLGTLAVLLTYVLTRRLFDWPTAAIASLALAVSFWSLMYSRTGQRHISVTVTTLLSFYFLWRAVQRSTADHGSWSQGAREFVLAGVFMGLGFYTYFASRGVPLIVFAWAIYLAIWRHDWWRDAWRGIGLCLLVALLLGIPLMVTLRQQPEAETRVSEVARPLHDACNGDFSTLGRYTLTTLAMFTHDGDEEWLYNIPRRPVFGVLGGVLFWGGIVLALVRTFGTRHDPRMAFLLLWIAAGIMPGMLSVPAASLGHTILAQPAAMMFPALALTAAGRWLIGHASQQQLRTPSAASAAVFSLALIFLLWEAIRGPYDYFAVWPADRYNRVLHHTDLHEGAAWLNTHAQTPDVAIGSYIVERWDQQVMRIDLAGEGWRVRAFDPRSAFIEIPGGGIAVLPEYLASGWGAEHLGERLELVAPYALHPINPPGGDAQSATLAAFDNGLTLAAADISKAGGGLVIISTWRVERALDLPPFPLYSKPPAPGEDDTPRLAIFIQLLDGNGLRAAGADGLGVDPYTLLPGDVFVQRSEISLDGVAAASYQLVIGLYNPMTGQRNLDTHTGQDKLLLQRIEIP